MTLMLCIVLLQRYTDGMKMMIQLLVSFLTKVPVRARKHGHDGALSLGSRGDVIPPSGH